MGGGESSIFVKCINIVNSVNFEGFWFRDLPPRNPFNFDNSVIFVNFWRLLPSFPFLLQKFVFCHFCQYYQYLWDGQFPYLPCPTFINTTPSAHCQNRQFLNFWGINSPNFPPVQPKLFLVCGCWVPQRPWVD